METVCDCIRDEFRDFQMDVIPDTYLYAGKELSKGRRQISYWEMAFEDAGIPSVENDSAQKVFCIDTLLNSLQKMCNESGKAKYPMLTSFFKIAGSLSHGNSAPENGFSINKFCIDVHGCSIHGDTLEAIRVTKDTILSYGSILDIPITRRFLQSVSMARERYNADWKVRVSLKKQKIKLRKRRK